MANATTNQTNQGQQAPKVSFPVRIAGLVASLPQTVSHHFSAIGHGLTLMANEMNTQQQQLANKPMDAEAVRAWNNDLRRQLDHLCALAGLQQAHLNEKRPHDPLALEISIYALSGMREQIEANIEAYERLLSPGPNDSVPGAPLGQPAPEAHQPHDKTKVHYGPVLGGFLGIGAPRSPNDVICEQLIGSCRGFVRTAQSVSEAFRLAGAVSLLELSTPMDELRALAVWMRGQEDLYYERKA